ncbi:MAG: D-alanine--D-alanine ligase [Clostridiales bacterium]|nr:D-alanine--D-alanine ligase [Clostridiales bacterium]
MGKLTVGVIFGGRTVEHEVSIISALQAILALNPEKYTTVPIYISKQGIWYTGPELLELDNYQDLEYLIQRLKPVCFSPNYGDWRLTETGVRGLWKQPWTCRLDVALPILHGTHGEDGCVQGLLELTGIPYAGPGILGAALGMDKVVMKAVLKEAGLPVIPYLWFNREAWFENEEAVLAKVEAELCYPLIVKPANLGSSIGIGRAIGFYGLREAINAATVFAERLIIEEAISPMRELNCAVLGNSRQMAFSFIEEPLAAAEILSFSDKYLSGDKGMSSAKRRIPADIDQQTANEIGALSRRAFEAMDGAGVCRIDFIMNSQTGRVYINEMNTIPGSLSFYLFEPAGLGFTELLDELIRLALVRYRVKGKTVYTYDSNILSQGGFKGK